MTTPRIADVQCSRLRFEDGDKVLVRVYQKLSRQESNRLKNMIQKWASPAEVLVVDCTLFDVRVDKGQSLLLLPGDLDGSKQ